MEWAWMPMAARMNEKATDLVYWVPPIYNSAISHGSDTPVRTSLRRRASSMRRASSISDQPSIRKRKLAHRRAKLRASDSVLNDMEDQNTQDVDEELETKDDLPFPEVHNVQLVTKGSLKYKKENVATQTIKFKHIPALLKTLEKVTSLYNHSKTNPKTQNKKKKTPSRPSMKIYAVPPQRSSFRNPQKKLLDIQRASLKSVLPITSSPFFPLKAQKVLGASPKQAQDNHSPCQIMFCILTKFCESKLKHQKHEIDQLKARLLQQEKVLKHTVELALDLKGHFIHMNTKLVNRECVKAAKRDENCVPYVPLQSVNEETTDESCSESVNASMDDTMHPNTKRTTWSNRHMWPHKTVCLSESLESFESLDQSCSSDVFRSSLRVQLQENVP